jgi:FKBP-type peptidyl-prolyl cis-trans isomerase
MTVGEKMRFWIPEKLAYKAKVRRAEPSSSTSN